MQDHFRLPSDWTGAIDAQIKWRAAATANSVTWGIQTACVADGETMDNPTFNTASTVADTAKGTTLQTNDASITGITATGCAAGEELFWKLYRDTGDSMTGNAELIQVTLIIRRAM